MRFFVLLMCALWVAPPAVAAMRCKTEVGRGEASWYGPGFEGGITKANEPFDPAALTAAHPTLPFGTILKVTNLRNARTVYVRVNDRGAFGKQRLIDLSEGAAQQIGMIDSGTAAVDVYQCDVH